MYSDEGSGRADCGILEEFNGSPEGSDQGWSIPIPMQQASFSTGKLSKDC
jgi:hypothetical protein